MNLKVSKHFTIFLLFHFFKRQTLNSGKRNEKKKRIFQSYVTEMTPLICTSCKTRQNMVSANLRHRHARRIGWQRKIETVKLLVWPCSIQNDKQFNTPWKSIVHYKTLFCHQQVWHQLNYFMFTFIHRLPICLVCLALLHCHIRFLIRLGYEGFYIA